MPGIRPGQAKGPWVGMDETGGGGGVTGVAGVNGNIPVFHDDFKTEKPFWDGTEALTSGDFSINTGTEKLDGIAQSKKYAWIRRGVEGDIDFAVKLELGSSTSAGIYLTGNGLEARISRTSSGDLAIDMTGEAATDPDVGADTMWVRITWNATGLIRFYWKINDVDAWTLQQSYTGKNFGHHKILLLDTCTGGYYHRVVIYDSVYGMATRSIMPKVIPLAEEATISVDASEGNLYTVTLTGNRALGAPTNPIAGQRITFRFEQDGTGSRVITYNAIYRFPTGEPVLQTEANAIDYVTFQYHESDDKWDFIGQNSDTSFVYQLTDAANISVDASAASKFRVTLGGNRTLDNPTNPRGDGQLILFRITQDGTGGRTLAYDTKYRFSTDIPSPTLSVGAGDIDYLGFIYHATDDKWDCIAKVFGF